MFNLDESIAEWRQQMLAAGVKTPVPLDELEGHLRDDVEERRNSGFSEQQAFEVAVQQIAGAGALKSEFAKVDELTQVLQRKAVWILISLAFLPCWIQFGQSPAAAFIYGVLVSGLIVVTFIDIKHFVIPDGITIGGVLIGLLCSSLRPQLHGQKFLTAGLLQSLLGIAIGAGLVYLVLRTGKLAFGRQRLALPTGSRVIFTETALLLPDRAISYDELFYRKSDAITLRAGTVELAGRSYQDVPIRLTSTSLQVGDDKYKPEAVSRMEAVSAEIVVPREAMGLGDVKLMAAIGAFLGWQAVVFSLVFSSIIGSAVGAGLIAARRREWSSRLPYGPYMALAAVIWMFGGNHLFEALFRQ